MLVCFARDNDSLLTGVFFVSCGKRTYDGAHVKGSDVLAVNTLSSIIDSKNDTYYLHGIKDCPDLSKTFFPTMLSPT